MFQFQYIRHKNPLLDCMYLSGAHIQAKLFPNLGASLQQLQIKGVEIIHGIEAKESDIEYYQTMYPSSFLFPFPGRIEGGTYTFENKTYQLPRNEKGRNNAIHGLIANKPFELVYQNLDSSLATLDFQYHDDGQEAGFPFPFSILIRYQFTENTLDIFLNIQNCGTQTFPFGIGWHPYFKVENLSECELHVPSDEKLQVNEHQIPIGSENLQFQSKIGHQVFDDSYLQKVASTYFSSQKYGFEMLAKGAEKNVLQVYTPPKRNAIAIEPMTCAPDVFNNKLGLVCLAPQEKFQWSIQLNFTIP